METPVCPLISIRNPEVLELCVEEKCALYLPQAKKCSLVFLGYKAMMEAQALRQTQG